MVVIQQARLWQYGLPLARPLVLSKGSVPRRDGLLVQLADVEGRTGWGEAAPLPGFSRETIDEAREALLHIVPELAGRRITLDGSRAEWEDLLPSVRHALELALINLGGSSALPNAVPDVAVNGLILESWEHNDPELKAVVAAGFRAVKVKVGRRSPAEECERLRAFSELFGPNVGLRLDANRRWDIGDAQFFARQLQGLPIEYVEEPLRAVSDLPRWFVATGLPLALDETYLAQGQAALDRIEGVTAVVVKPTLLGGWTPVLALAKDRPDLSIVVSSAFESGVGMHGLATLASIVSPAGVAGLGTAAFFDRDVTDPALRVKRGRVSANGQYHVRQEELEAL